MVTRLEAACAIDCADRIGEAPAWDPARQRVIWLDHETGDVHAAMTADGSDWRETRRWALQRRLAAVIPRAGGGFICAAGADFLLMDEAGQLTPFACLPGNAETIMLNDAKCDSQGRLWASAMARDLGPTGGLYRLDSDGHVHLVERGLRLPNGLDWSPDESTFYLADSLALCVYAFDFDVVRGVVERRRVLLQFVRGEGGPNGMAVDDEGGLWVALTGGGEVRRYSPRGELIARVAVATPGPTSCAFGGEDGGVLFITSRSGRLPDFARTEMGVANQMLDCTGPLAGGMWTCRPGPSGPAATPFAG
jgi:sugar lactone lactonase YvrE